MISASLRMGLGSACKGAQALKPLLDDSSMLSSEPGLNKIRMWIIVGTNASCSFFLILVSAHLIPTVRKLA